MEMDSVLVIMQSFKNEQVKVVDRAARKKYQSFFRSPLTQCVPTGNLSLV